LILDRREALRRPAAARTGAREWVPRAAAAEPRPDGRAAERGQDAGAEGGEDDTADDPIDRFAREGFAALERFGAEIEAMFGVNASDPGRPVPGPESATDAPPGARAEPSPAEFAPRAAAPRPAPVRLAELDAELARRLSAEGIVVRGHDVARVVGLATGRSVAWTD
jgi:hypothetical protein